MKKTITILLAAACNFLSAQTVADFESFSLPANSFYKDTNSVDFQTTNAIFQYDWDKSFGGFWSKGFSYTNKNDSTNGGFTNLYNCIAYKGYNNSNYYLSAQANGIIKLKTPSHNTVDGFYVTNSTYAYKSMKNGDSFAKKFGGVSGNDPDFFKITVKGFLGGTMKSDSVEYYLADFRFSNNAFDYILRTWQWVNCSSLGVVDSIQFFMYSSDNSSWGMNTPAFFCLDNFTTSQGVGIAEYHSFQHIKLYPNPASDIAFINLTAEADFTGKLKIYNATGALMKDENIEIKIGENNISLTLENFQNGIYFVELSGDGKKNSYKLIKN